MHNEAAAQLQKQLATEEQENKVAFHAKPLPKSTFEKSFTIEIPDREPLRPRDLNLHVEQRAADRSRFDEKAAAARTAAELEKERGLLEKERLEKEAIKKLRKMSIAEGGMQFTATPVLDVDPYPSRHVEPAPLTEPKTPKFSNIQRKTVSDN